MKLKEKGRNWENLNLRHYGRFDLLEKLRLKEIAVVVFVFGVLVRIKIERVNFYIICSNTLELRPWEPGSCASG